MGLLRAMSGAGALLLVSLLLLYPRASGGQQAAAGAGRRGPWLEREPPALLQYSGARAVSLHCAASGEPAPALSWQLADGTPLHDQPPHRRVYSNGTLELWPGGVGGAGGAGGAGGEGAVVQCRASSARGTALSREVTLQATDGGGWALAARAPPAVAHGVATLACEAASAARTPQHPRWFRDDTPLLVPPPHPESRLLAAGELLLLRDAAATDAGRYSCEAHARRSTPALLVVTEWSPRAAPRLTSAGSERHVTVGEDFCLPCAAADQPPPHYTWYRSRGGQLTPVAGSAGGEEGAWLWAGGAALCVRGAAPAHAGVWLCKAYNAFGDATAHHRLDVQPRLTVTVSPKLVVGRAGEAVRLTCTASDARAALAWLHDGVAAGAGAVLAVRAARPRAGVYQCTARRGTESAQDQAEIRLGDSAPELVYTFIEQALRPGGAVSLRCAAAAAPRPRLAWLLDAQPLDPTHRYSVSSETVANGDSVSTLNITDVTTADGGRYTCRATNALGSVEHSARLNIYGPPSIRALAPVRLVAGENATIYCPYSGYPISSVSWWPPGAGAALGSTGRVSARGAVLRLVPARPGDAGHYSCAVAAPAPPAARQDVEIQVRNPPKISPFIFSSDLTEGSSVQVLCGVSSGDKPMYFSWLKDGAPLPPNLQIEEKSLNEFSLLMFPELSARHSGAYTCRVANHAAAVNYTATLTVNVAPAWATEPLDAAMMLGSPLLLECAATGQPSPNITWHRMIGENIGARIESEQWEVLGGGAWGVASGIRVRNGSLVTATVARQHQGLYRCTADNGVGPPLVKHVNVTVHEPARFESRAENVSSVRGHSVVLTCVALGDAPLTVHWTHRGRRLDLDSFRWTVTEARAGGGLRSTLTLRAVESDDGGEYRCHTRNRHGGAELSLWLAVEEPPGAPRGLRLAGVGCRWVRLAWRAPAAVLRYTAVAAPLHARAGTAPGLHALNVTLDVALETDNNDGSGAAEARVWARVDRLRPAAAYSVRVAAANHVGLSPYSEALVFTTLEEAPAASPLNIRVKPVEPGEFHVTWSMPPPDSWNGELLGYVVSWREAGGAGAGAGGGQQAAHGGSCTDVTLSELRGGVRYSVWVRAFNVAGASPVSPPVYATTTDGELEEPPAAVSCEPASATSVRVRWEPPPRAAPAALRGYDIYYSPADFLPTTGGPDEAAPASVRTGATREAALAGLQPATNYSLWVRGRSGAGPGPFAEPASCTTHDAAPGAVRAVRALAAATDAVRVTWLAPRQAHTVTHYTLHTRELGKVGGEWSQRVEVPAGGEGGEEEVWREVRGLRAAVYEVWVRAASRAGAGPASPPLTAAPAPAGAARVTSLGRVVVARRDARVLLPCAAVGAPPLRRRWAPLPPAHHLTDKGDLLLQKVSAEHGGNYTCSVRNVGGSDAAVFTLVVASEPRAPNAPRVTRAAASALHLVWDAPGDGGAHILGYVVEWSRAENGGGEGAGAGRVRLPGGDTALRLARLACGAQYRVTLRAYNALGHSLRSPPLLATTAGHKAMPAPGKEFVWANSSTLRVNLLAWRARCPVHTWRVAVRGTASAWRDLPTDGESAAAAGLPPAACHELRVRAATSAGETLALYRACTRALTGENIGEAEELKVEDENGAADATGGRGNSGASVASGALALGCGAVVLVAVLAAGAAVRRCACRPRRPRCAAPPLQQLYSTEPGKRGGKAASAGVGAGGGEEISPYATFSMSEGACALQLRTFGRAEAELAAPPPRPNLLAAAPDPPAGYGRARSSDSESSGSPCAACAADRHLYRAAQTGALPVESSAEDTMYSGGGRGSRHSAAWPEQSERAALRTALERSERAPRHTAAAAASRHPRRRDHAAPPTLRSGRDSCGRPPL